MAAHTAEMEIVWSNVASDPDYSQSATLSAPPGKPGKSGSSEAFVFSWLNSVDSSLGQHGLGRRAFPDPHGQLAPRHLPRPPSVLRPSKWFVAILGGTTCGWSTTGEMSSGVLRGRFGLGRASPVPLKSRGCSISDWDATTCDVPAVGQAILRAIHLPHALLPMYPLCTSYVLPMC